MSRKESILIVDDDVNSRSLIQDIFQNEYDVIEAANGSEAIDVLRKSTNHIAAIVLDWIMPVMSGEDFLVELRKNNDYSSIPVIITTGLQEVECEQRALELGAWDFVSKPFNFDIIRFRVKNVIEKSLLMSAERDHVTGIYSKERFFQVTRELLSRDPEKNYVFIRFDIDRFKMINNFYGLKEGDRILKLIADQLVRISTVVQPFCYGKIDNDVFVCCMENKQQNIDFLVNSVMLKMKTETKDYHIKLSFGIYNIEDNFMGVAEIYDRALLAAKSCKGKFDHNIGYYNSDMIENLKKEQGILNDVNKALKEEQFHVYLQPKFDLRTNKPYGAEALVRWIHPENGMISPGVFIPLFEKNGFIGKLDLYMWTHVCKILKRWIDEGKDPAPISVNVSRVNLYNPFLAENLQRLVLENGVPPQLLNLELTESAFMEDQEVVMETMDKLRNMGFKIMMDDFGSGYSSLNVLKDIELDYLKVDMKFLQNIKTSELDNGKGEKILTSVIRMAKWLEIPSIVEGVETQKQIDFLKSIGCEYVQGFYFAKPMPVEEYEKFVDEAMKDASPILVKTYKADEVISEMWKSSSSSNLLFEHIDIPMAFFEYKNENIELMRVNAAFSNEFGYDKIAICDNADSLLLDDKDKEYFHKAFSLLVGPESIEYFGMTFKNGIEYKAKLQIVDKRDDVFIVLAVFQNINKIR